MSEAGFDTRAIYEAVLVVGDAVRKYITNICNHAVANKRDYLNQIAVLKTINVYSRKLRLFRYHLNMAKDADDLKLREYLA